MAAKNQHLMPTTEGALDFKLNMTNLLGGYPGHEHSIPVYPSYKDVIKTIADAKMIGHTNFTGSLWRVPGQRIISMKLRSLITMLSCNILPLTRNWQRSAGWFMDEEHILKNMPNQ